MYRQKMNIDKSLKSVVIDFNVKQNSIELLKGDTVSNVDEFIWQWLFRYGV